MRQQQNQYCSLSSEDVRDMPEELAALCGFSLYREIMGHIDGPAPGRFIGAEGLAETACAARLKAIDDEGGQVGGIGAADPAA